MNGFLQSMDRIPPPMAALIARRGRSPMTLDAVAKAAGISKQRAVWITSMTSWAKVPTGEASAFLAACGVTPASVGQQLQYIKRASKAKSPLSKRLQKGGASRLLAALASQQTPPAG